MIGYGPTDARGMGDGLGTAGACIAGGPLHIGEDARLMDYYDEEQREAREAAWERQNEADAEREDEEPPKLPEWRRRALEGNGLAKDLTGR